MLGHALYMKAVHGGKTKNDRQDARTIARLLRGGTFPLAYVYPKEKRATRDLLRRRTHFVRKRAEHLAHGAPGPRAEHLVAVPPGADRTTPG